MTYNPDIHHRRSIRLKGYDYSQAGAYSVTICTKDRVCMFGDIADGQMWTNDAGNMIGKWWMELTNKFPDMGLDEYIVMPNHLHGIINIVGADLSVCPDKSNGNTKKGAHTGSPLHRIIQWFKTMTTNDYINGVKQSGWPPFNRKLWHRNYYEHIIRDERALNSIRRYIQANPCLWSYDNENPARVLSEIDRVLAEHYGFTDEEIDFIVNYDIKYRIGRDSENGE
jgi:REP element-mobilizing transposase RayT